jgi:CRISPR-associated protein Csm5
LLVGDGRKLSPIDYMVWKDQINVLDQRRIFRLLAKGPRLDGYLAQLKRADKLDFASWGGFAQNFADRRIPFEHPACSGYWERAQGESLHIPTFFSGVGGSYLPGTAIKGALRTGLVLRLWKSNALAEVAAQLQGERAPRRPAEVLESRILGGAGTSRMRVAATGDSLPVPASVLKIYLSRVATLQARGAGKFELGWKQSPRGTVDGRRPEDSTPWFAEMAAPGTIFEGAWQENTFLEQAEIVRALNWKEPMGHETIFRAANDYAAGMLAAHKQYAEWTGLSLLERNLDELSARLAEAGQTSNRCLISIGWGCGILGKTALLRDDANYRQILQQVPLYSRALSSGLPFPKTRRIVFLGNQPATLPGWALLEIA